MKAIVSVVIPTFNRLWALPQSVSQFLNNPLVKEIIIIDDGSSDGTREWLRQQAKNHPGIKPIFHEQNLGPSAARRNGIAHSTGEYLFFWDDDMLIYPTEGLAILMNELFRYDGDVIAPAITVANLKELYRFSTADISAEPNYLLKPLIFERRTGHTVTRLPRQTFRSHILPGLTLQCREIFDSVTFGSSFGFNGYREETDLHCQMIGIGKILLACPKVFAVDLDRPLENDGGCHSEGTHLRYEIQACRNNWHFLKNNANVIHAIVGKQWRISVLQCIYVGYSLLYRLPRKLAGRFIRFFRMHIFSYFNHSAPLRQRR